MIKIYVTRYPQVTWPDSGCKLFDTLMIFLKEIFEQVTFESGSVVEC